MFNNVIFTPYSSLENICAVCDLIGILSFQDKQL